MRCLVLSSCFPLSRFFLLMLLLRVTLPHINPQRDILAQVFVPIKLKPAWLTDPVSRVNNKNNNVSSFFFTLRAKFLKVFLTVGNSTEFSFCLSTPAFSFRLPAYQTTFPRARIPAIIYNVHCQPKRPPF